MLGVNLCGACTPSGGGCTHWQCGIPVAPSVAGGHRTFQHFWPLPGCDLIIGSSIVLFPVPSTPEWTALGKAFCQSIYTEAKFGSTNFFLCSMHLSMGMLYDFGSKLC